MNGSEQQSLKYMRWGSEYVILFRTGNMQKQIFFINHMKLVHIITFLLPLFYFLFTKQ